MKSWSSEEIRILTTFYNRVSNEELQKMIPSKTWIAIYKKAYKMGLRKTEENSFLNRSIARRREKCNFWKGGTRRTSKGYNSIKMPEHHRADGEGYVLEHILVFEEKTGIKVPDNCCIHHLNGVKKDNRIENLCMMDRSAHTIYHHSGKKRTNETRKKISESKRLRDEQGSVNGKIV